MTDDELERTIEAASDFMDAEATGAGIDAELLSLTGMTAEERRVLEWFALNSRKLTADERTYLHRAVQRLLLATKLLRAKSADADRENARAAREHRRSTRSLYLWVAIPLLFLGVATYRDATISVDTNDGTVMYVQTSWWGISRREREIRWIQSQDLRRSYWMAQDKQGTWYPFLVEE